MTALTIQKLHFDDCESEFERSYFDWGRGWGGDSPEPDWGKASPEQRRAIGYRGYQLYDGWPPVLDDDVGALESYVSVGINSRVILNDVVRFLVHKDRARPLLARIPVRVPLEDATDEQVAVAAQLIDLFCSIPKLGRGKVTKVLHKKRPEMIPVIDSVVTDFLWKNFPHLLTEGSSTAEVLLVYRMLLNSRREPLHRLQANLRETGFQLGTARILSHLVWLGWNAQVDAYGFGPPLKSVWGTDSLDQARQRARAMWEEQRGATGR